MCASALEREPVVLRDWLAAKRKVLRWRLAGLLQASGAGQHLRFNVGGSVRIALHQSALSRTLWCDRSGREDDAAFLRGYLRPGDVYVDVGANIGHLALVAAEAVGESGRVWAIEPHPRIFGYMVHNIELNAWARGRITALNAGLGRVAGLARLTDGVSDDQNCVTSSPSAVCIAQLTLDALATCESRTDLLKVDTEGYEVEVLSGGRSLLSRSQCLYVELSARQLARFGHTPRDLLALLHECGFSCFGRVAGTPLLAPIDATYTPSMDCENIVGCHESGLERLKPFLQSAAWG